MGLFSGIAGIFGGGTSASSASNSSTDVTVSVNPQIANVIDTEPLKQPLDKLANAWIGSNEATQASAKEISTAIKSAAGAFALSDYYKVDAIKSLLLLGAVGFYLYKKRN